MRIDNEYADQLLVDFRRGERVGEFMDAISGVKDYRIDNLNKQGHIRGMFAKELISEQFLLELEDIVSIFWKGVFESIDKAKLWGEQVTTKNNEVRGTNNNPIHFLRRQGDYAVRNYITSLYQKNLRQSCIICGHSTIVKNHKVCTKCSGSMVTIYKYIEIKENINELSMPEDSSLEDTQMADEINNILDKFADAVLMKGTRAYQVLKILVDPQASVDMCSVCKLCDSNTFNIAKCTNYNANIGKYLGVNKTMIANKIRRIRKALPEFLLNCDSQEANYLLSIIPKEFQR